MGSVNPEGPVGGLQRICVLLCSQCVYVCRYAWPLSGKRILAFIRFSRVPNSKSKILENSNYIGISLGILELRLNAISKDIEP